MKNRFHRIWRRWWTRYAGPHGCGRMASRLAAMGTVPYHGREFLARIHARGYVDPGAGFAHERIRLGEYVYVGDRVYAFDPARDGGTLELGDEVSLYGDTIIHTGAGGGVFVGRNTHIQPGCFLDAYLSDIRIGERVEIAPCCAFYSGNHGVEGGEAIMDQGFTTKGPVIVGDGAWLGQGVTVLSGVRIGAGAVVGASSLVTKDVPEKAIAGGVPAKVLKFRDEAGT